MSNELDPNMPDYMYFVWRCTDHPEDPDLSDTAFGRTKDELLTTIANMGLQKDGLDYYSFWVGGNERYYEDFESAFADYNGNQSPLIGNKGFQTKFAVTVMGNSNPITVETYADNDVNALLERLLDDDELFTTLNEQLKYQKPEFKDKDNDEVMNELKKSCEILHDDECLLEGMDIISRFINFNTHSVESTARIVINVTQKCNNVACKRKKTFNEAFDNCNDSVATIIGYNTVLTIFDITVEIDNSTSNVTVEAHISNYFHPFRD
ncbi:hypothetical protein BX667DRAFT_535855 [Coemansia mojavensis]|nr:hypothetical protein BX667DRAFT_535855 [Coemansia mojavensis]